MRKSIIYTNKDNQDFIIEENNGNFKLEISNGSNELYFLDSEEVEEFIGILREYKMKTWN